MPLLSDGMEWLADTLLAETSLTATYTRGAYSVSLSVIPSRPDFIKREPGQGGRVQLDEDYVDFHLAPADLVLNSVQVNPERGDRLTIGTLTREVSPGDGRPCWGRSDPFGNLIRVTTQLVAVT